MIKILWEFSIMNCLLDKKELVIFFFKIFVKDFMLSVLALRYFNLSLTEKLKSIIPSMP